MWLRIALFLSIIAAVLFIVATVVGYHLLKYIFRELRTDHFDSYSNETRKIIDRYTDCPIVRAYVLRSRVSRCWLVGFHILWLFLSENLRRSTMDIFHQSLLLEVETPDGPRFIIIEKTCELVVRDTVRLSPSHTLTPIALSSDEQAVNSLLASTQKAMGDDHFFNWRTDSTCQDLVATLAKQLDLSNAVASPNVFEGVSDEDAYIMNKMLYYYYKAMRMLLLDKQILRYVT